MYMVKRLFLTLCYRSLAEDCLLIDTLSKSETLALHSANYLTLHCLKRLYFIESRGCDPRLFLRNSARYMEIPTNYSCESI